MRYVEEQFTLANHKKNTNYLLQYVIELSKVPTLHYLILDLLVDLMLCSDVIESCLFLNPPFSFLAYQRFLGDVLTNHISRTDPVSN